MLEKVDLRRVTGASGRPGNWPVCLPPCLTCLLAYCPLSLGWFIWRVWVTDFVERTTPTRSHELGKQFVYVVYWKFAKISRLKLINT